MSSSRRTVRRNVKQPPPKTFLRGLIENLVVLGITLFLIALLLEFGLRIFAPQIVEPITGLFVADPATGYRLAPNSRVQFRFAEGNPTFAVNSQGLREDEVVGLPPEGSTRLLALGDSFTFGMGVEAAQAFPALLEGTPALGGTVDAVNAGVFGYGTDNEAAWLSTYGWEYQPKIVLVGFFAGNDVKDVMLGMDKTTVDSSGRLVATDESREAMGDEETQQTEAGTTEQPTDGGIKGWLEQNSHAYLFVRGLYYNLTGPRATVQEPDIFDAASFFLKQEPAEITAGWQKTFGVLDGLKADVEAHGAALVVVAIPTREQVHDNYWEQMKTQFGLAEDELTRDLPEQKLEEWAAASNTPLIDLLPAFREAGANQQLYFRTDRHWNSAGHALAAQLISEQMAQIDLAGR